MDRKTQDLVLGGVFFAALATLLAATFYLSDVEALFVERARLEVDFDEVGALSPGNSVFVKGYRVGEVGELDYNIETRRVRVTMVMQQSIPLFEDYVVLIQDGTLLGGKQVDIDPGTSTQQIETDQVLSGTYGGGPFDALAGVDGQGINTIIENLAAWTSNEESTVYRLFNEDGLYTQVTEIAESAQRILAQVEQGPGTVHDILYDETMAQNLTDTVEGFRDFATSINDPEQGVIGALTNDTSLLDRLNEIVDNINATAADLQKDDGLLGRLLRESALADNVAAAIEEFRKLGENVNDPEAGIVGALVADKEWRRRVDVILTDVEELTQSLANGDGLLGRLINDPAIAEQFDRILNQVSRAIEDAREAAPVSTFFSVITGAF